MFMSEINNDQAMVNTSHPNTTDSNIMNGGTKENLSLARTASSGYVNVIIVSTVTELVAAATTQGAYIQLQTGEYNLPGHMYISDGVTIEARPGVIIDADGRFALAMNNNQNITIKNVTFRNMLKIDIISCTNITFENCTFDTFVQAGVNLEQYQLISFFNCTFRNIGTGTINPTWQGCGIYAKVGVGLTVHECEFLYIYGHAGIFLISSTEFNIFRTNIHDVAYRGINLHTGKHSGVIDHVIISNCGIINTTGSGVGCNGIYGVYTAETDLSEVQILHPIIRNVMENGIEGAFGLIESPIIDGTGIDPIGHPTSSIEGIWVENKDYPKVVRNAYLRNIGGDGIKTYTGDFLRKTYIYNTVLEENTANLSRYAVRLTSDQGYVDVLIDGVVSKNKRPLFLTDRACANTYANGIRAINAGVAFASPGCRQLRTTDGFDPIAIKNKYFVEWTSATELTNWKASSAILSQVVSGSSYVPKLRVTSGGYAGRITQDVLLPDGEKTYYIEVEYTGDTNTVLRITPYNTDGTALDSSKVSAAQSSSFSDTETTKSHAHGDDCGKQSAAVHWNTSRNTK